MGLDELRLTRLLVGTDFSAGARAALTRVARLPLAESAEVTVAYVVPEGGDLFVDRGTEAAVQRLLADEVNALKKLAPRLKVRPQVVRGRPVHALVELGKKLEPELVVVGRHGERGDEDGLLGSTAERVLQLANRPILVVSRTARAPYKRAVAAVDLEPGSLEVLAQGLMIAGVRAAGVTLVHAFGREYDRLVARGGVSKDKLRHYRQDREAGARARLAAELIVFPALAERAKQQIAAGDPRQVLLDTVKKTRAQLLVVGTHGRSGEQAAVLGSVAQALARRAPCDVLVVPTPLLAES